MVPTNQRKHGKNFSTQGTPGKLRAILGLCLISEKTQGNFLPGLRKKIRGYFLIF